MGLFRPDKELEDLTNEDLLVVAACSKLSRKMIVGTAKLKLT